MKLVTPILLAISISTIPALVSAQIRPPTLDSLRALGLDSVGGDAVAYFRPEHRERAVQVHALLTQFVGFARDDLDITVTLRVAVLDSADWGRATSTPYGLPTNSGLGADNLLLAAVEPPGRVGARRMPAGQASDFLTVGHEGGHLLTWQLLPDAMKEAATGDEPPSPEVMAQFRALRQVPAWYWEMVANYFATAFLRATQPDGARAWLQHLQEISDVPRPRFTALDDWFTRVMEATAPDSTPYRLSDEGGLNQGWYQGVVGQLAAHVHDRSGLEFMDHIRSTLADPSASTTENLVAQLESIAPGTTTLLTRLGAEWK